MKITEKELKNLIKEVILESHTKADEEKLKKMSKKLRGSSKLHAKQADELEDIVDRSDDEELEEAKPYGRYEDEKPYHMRYGKYDPDQGYGIHMYNPGFLAKMEKEIKDSEAKERLRKKLQQHRDEVAREFEEEGEVMPPDYFDNNPYLEQKIRKIIQEEIQADLDEQAGTFVTKGMARRANQPLKIAKKMMSMSDETEDEAAKKVRRHLMKTFPSMSADDINNIIKKAKSRGSLEEKKKTDKERMKCNSPRRIRKGEAGHGKKKFVVKACKDGKEKIIRYGDANLEIKKDSPKRRKSFRARHKCDTAKDKMSARYWSCKKW